MRVQEKAAGNVTENMTAQTINILKVELAKESPEVWARLRGKLLGDDALMVGGPEGSTAGMRFNLDKARKNYRKILALVERIRKSAQDMTRRSVRNKRNAPR